MELIKEQFDKVIQHSQIGIDDPQTDWLFETWQVQKKHIKKAFGDRLIYELPEKVTFELGEDAKNCRIQSFIDSMWDLGFEELARFLGRQRDGFYKNSVTEEYRAPDSKGTIITKNTKLIKAFKYFIENQAVLTDLQNRASQLIQENKVEGTLCFSIHPLDYLSVSENTYNWRSCHALDGEYRAGNLSYMVDSSTIVCYLKGENEAKLPNFPEDVLWNSKKWRVLLYLSDNWKMVFAGKQYPFASESGMNYVLNILNDKFIKNPFDSSYARPRPDSYWTEWTDYTIGKIENDKGISFGFDDEYIPLDDGLKSLYRLVKDGTGSKHFNDVLKSSCYKPMYTYLAYTHAWSNETYVYANSYTQFNIGGMTKCLYCGTAEVMDGSSTMMCYDCELEHGVSENDCFCFCERCGHRELTENSHWVGDSIYCHSCYSEYVEYCESCGEDHLRENMIYDEDDECYYCKWCYGNKQEDE